MNLRKKRDLKEQLNQPCQKDAVSQRHARFFEQGRQP
jgi:hypothetical protein